MKLSELTDISSVNEAHAIMEFEVGAAQNILPKRITFARIKAWIQGFIPASLKNPYSLTFSGGATGSYDGSAAKSLAIPIIPAALPNPYPLNFTGGATGAYNGNYEKTVAIPIIPAALPNPYPLNFTGGATGAYNGNYEKTVAIPIIPPALPNPHPLTFTGAVEGAYDGSVSREVYIPHPSRVSQPTGLSLSYPAIVSIRNGALQRIAARLLPAFNMQDCAIFLPASGEAIELYPDGTFRVKKLGVSRVYVVPTLAASAYRAVDITVRPAYFRRTGIGALRLTGAGKPRIL